MNKLLRFSVWVYPLLVGYILILSAESLHSKTFQSGDSNKRNSYTIVNVAIDQPNVNDCYSLSSDQFSTKDISWVKIFPNPNPGQFTLEVNLQISGKSLHIHIYDITGKLVFRSRETFEGQQFSKELNISFLEKGVYFIRITGEHRVGVKQIIIN